MYINNRNVEHSCNDITPDAHAACSWDCVLLVAFADACGTCSAVQSAPIE